MSLINRIIIGCTVAGAIILGSSCQGLSNNSRETDVNSEFICMLDSLGEYDEVSYWNLTDEDYNISIGRAKDSIDSKSTQIEVSTYNDLGYETGTSYTCTINNGKITGLPYGREIDLINTNHIVLTCDGTKQHLFSNNYIEQLADSNKPYTTTYRTDYGDELYVCIFEIENPDGEPFRLARIEKRGDGYHHILLLDKNNCAHDIWYIGSEEGESVAIRFLKDQVIVEARNCSQHYKKVDKVAKAELRKLNTRHQYNQALQEITLSSHGNTYFDASNLFDDDPTTAWAIGDKEFSKFEKETEGHFPRLIGLITNESVPVIEVVILNGYNKSAEAWRNNARVRNITIMGCHNDSNLADNLYEGKLDDSREPQTIRLTRTGIYDFYNLIIDDFYPGDKSNDIYISEIGLFAK